MKPFRVRVPATSANIGPGFDCLGVAVGLYLNVDCQAAGTFGIDLMGEGSADLPRDARNLLARCVRVGKALVEQAGASTPASIAQSAFARGAPLPDPPAVHLSIHNDIPLARGLGSSSAAIVAGIATGMMFAQFEKGSGARLDRHWICEAANAIEGHPDNVTPAALGDLVVSGVEAEELITLGLRWPASVHFVAIVPELAIRTEDARRALPAMLPYAEAVLNGTRLARLLAALQSGRFDQLRSSLGDRLHQPYRLPLATGLAETVDVLSRHPASLGAYLSGSGPTVMALCHDSEEAIGAAGVHSFAKFGVNARALSLQVDRTGLEVTSGST